MKVILEKRKEEKTEQNLENKHCMVIENCFTWYPFLGTILLILVRTNSPT